VYILQRANLQGIGKMKRFKVVSCHFTTECNLNCPFCYRPKESKQQKPFKFFKDMVPYLAELTDQVALGGGEAFLFPKQVSQFAKECTKNDIICNVTTNGTIALKKKYLKDLTLVSLSFDKFKCSNWSEVQRYQRMVEHYKKYVNVGANLLIDPTMFYKKKTFLGIVASLFEFGVDRVFALYPKNMDRVDILQHTDSYKALSTMFEHFYIDDLTLKILSEGKYNNWKAPCHYGKDIISINEVGEITGCSFDGPEKAIMNLEKPEDILEIKEKKMDERFSCPYLGNRNILEEIIHIK